MIQLVKPYPMDDFHKLVRLIQDGEPGAWNTYVGALEGMDPLHAASLTLHLQDALAEESEEHAVRLRRMLKGLLRLEVEAP
ncbi:MAG: hypothetical protein IPL96_00020 [Holophagaceae bacterium]|nr:hypothetical protein [Holophagaceae bacterium]